MRKLLAHLLLLLLQSRCSVDAEVVAGRVDESHGRWACWAIGVPSAQWVQKKHATKLLSTSLPNIYRFSKFFRRQRFGRKFVIGLNLSILSLKQLRTTSISKCYEQLRLQ